MCERCPKTNPPNNDICACLCQDIILVESFIGGKHEYCRTCEHDLVNR
jgi:hypothetical protein